LKDNIYPILSFLISDTYSTLISMKSTFKLHRVQI